MSTADLRPMSLGELLDRIFSLYRRHLWVFVGIMAIPSLMALAMALFVPSLQQPFPAGAEQAPDPAQVAGFVGTFVAGILIMSVVYWMVYAIALGATSFAVSEIHLGGTATVRGAYQRMRGKIWRLIDVTFSVMLRAFGLFMLIMLGTVALATSVGALVGSVLGTLAASLLMVVGMVGGMVLTVWIVLGYGVAIPAAVLENIRAREALKRSMFLTRGHRGKVFLIVLLTAVVTYAAMFLFQGPFWAVSFLTAAKGHPSLLLTYLTAISGTVAGAFVGPLMMIGLALLYFDLRIRKEAFDLQLMMDRLDQGAQAAAPASPPPPSPIG